MFYSHLSLVSILKRHSSGYLCSIVKPVLFVQMCPSLPKTVACIITCRSPPCVFSIPAHLAFRHATMTQWCCVTGQAGHWLFVSIQINHSLFWTDNVINAQKGHRVYSSRAWCGEQSGQQVNTLDWLSVTLIGGSRIMSKLKLVFHCSFLLRKNWMTGGVWNVFFNSPVTGCIPKVLGLFVVLIDIPVGKMSPQMPCIWQGLYSLMIRVNMAHGLHFYRRAGRNNTIAKIQPIWEKNNKKQHLTAQNAPHPRDQPQLLLHVRRGEL